MSIFDDLDPDQVGPFLQELLSYYVERQGLGSMPKADLDALVIYLYMVHAGIEEADPYELSRKFKIKESRVKTLLESAWIKFVDKSEREVWVEIIQALSVARIERESLEKAEVRFKLQNPGHMPYFRKEVRNLQGTVTYSTAAERVVLSLDTFNSLLERVFRRVFEQDEESVQSIKAIYRHIKNNVLSPEEAPDLDQRQTTKVGRSLERGAQLASIGGFIREIFTIGAAA